MEYWAPVYSCIHWLRPRNQLSRYQLCAQIAVQRCCPSTSWPLPVVQLPVGRNHLDSNQFSASFCAAIPCGVTVVRLSDVMLPVVPLSVVPQTARCPTTSYSPNVPLLPVVPLSVVPRCQLCRMIPAIPLPVVLLPVSLLPVALLPVALLPVGLQPVALLPVALLPVALLPVALLPIVNHNFPDWIMVTTLRFSWVFTITDGAVQFWKPNQTGVSASLLKVRTCGQNIYPTGVKNLKVHKHEIFFLLFLQKPKPYGPKGL